MDDWLEEAYEDRFYITDTDSDDGFEWGWDEEGSE
jgi:hypothetical protein